MLCNDHVLHKQFSTSLRFNFMHCAIRELRYYLCRCQDSEV